MQEYAKRQITKPRKHLDMEHIQQPNDRDSKCDCIKNNEVNISIIYCFESVSVVVKGDPLVTSSVGVTISPNQYFVAGVITAL